MYIGGVGVARGYWNRPELTAERFVPDPFATTPGARVYKTGDLARYRPDGTIQFLGRLDFQVKVRGFRIELGEIESVLERHPAVRQAVVLAREDRSGQKQLLAYLVCATEPTSEMDLHGHLRANLPDYMVPSVFVMLDAFPLTPNGKVDRRALPDPERTRPESGGLYVAPRSPVEQALASIWANVLRIERVGMNDHFFYMGGNSLLATRVMAQVRQVLGVELPLRSLFEGPTVAALALAVLQARAARTDADRIRQLLEKVTTTR
jgi:hypothetical protein